MMKRIDVKMFRNQQTGVSSAASRGSTTTTMMLLGSLLIIGCAAFWLLKSNKAIEPALLVRTPPSTPEKSGAIPDDAEPPQPSITHTIVKPAPVTAPLAHSVAASTPPIHEKAGSTVEAQQLITKITQFDLSAGALTAAQAKDFNQTIKQIVAQGKAAVPAIKEFLERNQDLNFSEISGGNPLDYSSLRQGLIESLEKIGGPEAIEVTVKTLETAGDPFEVALLARNLEKNAPEQYREMELKAAKESFAMALATNSDGHSIYPLLELYQRIGDASVVPDLEKAVTEKSAWRYQAALALSELPDGVGVPALIQLAKNPAVNAQDQGDLAYRALAQVAAKYPDARNALVEQARAGQVPATAWPGIASALSGTYVFSYGYQVFGLPENLPMIAPSQIPQQVALLDQLIAATSDPAAQTALREHRAALATRMK